MRIGQHFDRTRKKTYIARALRRSMTTAEQVLWRHLRNNQFCGIGFRRQLPIGPFVLDFYCPFLRLAVELDGGQHGCAPHVSADERRDAWLRSKNIRVLRFWNNEVLENLEGVLTLIGETVKILQSRIPTPTLPFSRGGSNQLTSPRKGEVGAKRRVGIDVEGARS